MLETSVQFILLFSNAEVMTCIKEDEDFVANNTRFAGYFKEPDLKF